MTLERVLVLVIVVLLVLGVLYFLLSLAGAV